MTPQSFSSYPKPVQLFGQATKEAMAMDLWKPKAPVLTQVVQADLYLT